jgi:hypothetical protein
LGRLLRRELAPFFLRKPRLFPLGRDLADDRTIERGVGGLPPGLVQGARLVIASIISSAFIGSLAPARTFAAASMALSFFSF